jgi:hypothetical protein
MAGGPGPPPDASLARLGDRARLGSRDPGDFLSGKVDKVPRREAVVVGRVELRAVLQHHLLVRTKITAGRPAARPAPLAAAALAPRCRSLPRRALPMAAGAQGRARLRGGRGRGGDLHHGDGALGCGDVERLVALLPARAHVRAGAQ